MHPRHKDSTINYPTADSWQPLILLTSALLLLFQRLTFKNSSAGFFRVLKNLDYYSIKESLCDDYQHHHCYEGKTRGQMLNFLRQFMRQENHQQISFGLEVMARLHSAQYVYTVSIRYTHTHIYIYV